MSWQRRLTTSLIFSLADQAWSPGDRTREIGIVQRLEWCDERCMRDLPRVRVQEI